MNIFCIFLLGLAIVGLPINGEALQEKPAPTVSIMEEIDAKFASSRKQVADLVKNNEDVLSQYDVFAKNLKQVYVTGEGLIDADIYRIIDGIGFAAYKHRIQTRKGAKQHPYIIHPIGVADQLIMIGHVRDPEIILAALLHDTVEDTDTTFEEIEKAFGIRVANFVRELTDDKSLAKEERKRLQIVNASHKSAGAAQVKLSDKLYNLKDLEKSPPRDWEKERIDAYFMWAKQVVDNLPWVNAPLKHAVDEIIANHKV